MGPDNLNGWPVRVCFLLLPHVDLKYFIKNILALFHMGEILPPATFSKFLNIYAGHRPRILIYDIDFSSLIGR